jgi:hypothetical protein
MDGLNAADVEASESLTPLSFLSSLCAGYAIFLNTINYEVFEGTALAFLILVSGVIFLRT